jgi:mono/diheme cytochrome c family protein
MKTWLSLALAAWVGWSAIADGAQNRTASEGVYSEEQARRGQDLFKAQCASCHGAALNGSVGPPLAGADFVRGWGSQPLADLADKIQHTMPATAPGTLTRSQAVSLVAHILQVNKFPAGRAELSVDDAVLKAVAFPAAPAAGGKPPSAAAQAQLSAPLGNLAQIMRGILFPSSNLIFAAQSQDPGAPKEAFKPGSGGFNWADWGAGIYSGWELVDYAAVTLSDVGPLLLVPRRCENGKPAPVERPDWIKYTQELTEAGRAVYKASQTRNQEAVSDATNVLADACLNCHVAYRDKPGGGPNDPSNKAARCVP